MSPLLDSVEPRSDLPSVQYGRNPHSPQKNFYVEISTLKVKTCPNLTHKRHFKCSLSKKKKNTHTHTHTHTHIFF